MFTGIIESAGRVIDITANGSNNSFWIESNISEQLKIDESVCHDGVCLTVEEIRNGAHKVTAIKETLDVTNIKEWKVGNTINLERALQMNGRLDGHIVQGHVDNIAICSTKKELKGSTELIFKIDKKFTALIIEKGSVCINGVSLTAFNVHKKKFTVAVIPYTLQNTNLCFINKDSKVNIEFDILGKYIIRSLITK
ncbi:MAG: riboflavin synthase [Bacteroidota bacterium]|nr:riboflavin synthase [Bacteroidota bacterium]